MAGEISSLTKYVFLLHFIVTLAFGSFWFVMPEVWNTLTGWPVEVASGRMVGMTAIMMAIGSIVAYQKTTWEQVEIYVIMELVFNILGAIGMLWNVFTMTLPVVAWMLIGLMGLFGILFLYIFFTARG